MDRIRSFFLRHRAMAMLMVMAALCMKVVVPTGFMIGQNSKFLTVQICADASGNNSVKQLVIPMKEGSGGSSDKQAKGDCPFLSLSMASMAGANAALLAVALVFILALGFAPVRMSIPRPVVHLRPPLRGPPALV